MKKVLPAEAQLRTYLAALPAAQRKRLREFRTIIRSAAPDAVDHFSYRMPAVKLDGKTLLWYAAWKEHTGIYPITAAIQRSLAEHLEGYETSKGTVRIPNADPLPVTLIKRLVLARVDEVRKAKE